MLGDVTRAATPVLLVTAVLVLTGCGADDGQATTSGSGASETSSAGAPQTSASASTSGQEVEQRHPDVLDASVDCSSADGCSAEATLSSPYDTPERYADAWRVRAVDDPASVYGVRELLHDHASEQPFTRSLRGLEVPADVDEVVVEGRDLVHGWGGDTVVVRVRR